MIFFLFAVVASNRVLVVVFIWAIWCHTVAFEGADFLLLDKLSLLPDSLLLAAVSVHEFAKTLSHTVGPHSDIVGTVAPDKPSEAVALVVFVLTLVQIARGENGATNTLNFLVLVKLAYQEITISRGAETHVKSSLIREGSWIPSFYLIDVQWPEHSPLELDHGACICWL